MKIRTKLLYLTAAVLVLVSALAAALAHHAAAGEQLRRVANVQSLQLATYSELRTSPLLLLDRDGGGQQLLRPMAQRIAQLRAGPEAALSQLERTLDAELQRGGEPRFFGERAHAQRLRAAWEAWLRADVLPLSGLTPGTPACREGSLRAASAFAGKVEPLLGEAVQRERQMRAQETAVNARVVRLSRTLATVGPLLSVGVLLTLLLTVVFPVHRGLRVLQAGARRLGAGQLDTEVRLRGRDELSVIAGTFNQMARELRESLEAQVRAKEAQALAAERELQHDSALLEQQVRARTAELEAMNQQLNASLRQLSETQAQLLFADRLASVGLLAAGVAHEVNNPLSFVLGNLRFARELLARGAALTGPERAELLEALGEAFVGADRVRLIVQDLKSFSRPEDADERPVDLQEVLRISVKMAGSELRHRAQVVEQYDAAPRVQGSEARLGQVFLNLLINAAQAIPPGHPERHEVRVTLGTDERGQARVEVRDTGTGIAPEDLAHIFDPFFTTKPVGAGTGLGLSVCHGIVSALGGSIQVQSRPGEGTTFRVTLPPAAEEAAAPGPAPTPAARPRAVQRLLVVDDEPAIGALVGRILGPHVQVTYARSGAEALAKLAATPEPFNAVLCDVMMPGMTGLELYGQVAREGRGRERDFIFMTGGALTPEVQRFLDEVPNPTLVKPFGPEPLLALLAERERATARSA